jgi:LPS O-antigen subunit length determinant protein (WzzB/FepE family)
MKLNKKMSVDEVVDLRELFIKLWKKKILIFFMSLAFMAIGFIYGTLQPKIYQTTITIREAPQSLFEEYRSIYNFYTPNTFYNHKVINENLNIEKQFNNEFKLQLLSIDSLVEFVEQNTELEYLKSYLSKKEISINVYFENKFKNEKNIKNVYSLFFSEPFLEKYFLDNYIIFIKKKTEEIFKKQLYDALTKKIQIYKYNLEISEKINVENSGKLGFSNQLSSISKEDWRLNIVILERILNETKDLKLNYNPIATKASTPKEISITWYSYLLYGFVFGFSLSILIIFLKKNNQN